MVASQTHTGSNTQNYELSQQARDAKSAAVMAKVSKEGKVTNLETWRKAIDVMLGLMHAIYLTGRNNNIHLHDPYDIQTAQAEVQTTYTTSQLIKNVKEQTHVKKEK
jgi:hypothetical protein